MATTITQTESRGNWGLYMFFGIVLALLGILALGSIAYTSVLSTVFLGWIFFVGGIVEFFSIFFRSGDRFSHAMLGILATLIGLIMIANPTLTLSLLVLLLGIIWTVGGLIKLLAALFGASEGGRGWNVFGGIVTFLLGLLVWIGWPATSVYIVGLFIGIYLLITGIVMFIYSFKLRKPPPQTSV